MKKINDMLETDVLKKILTKKIGVLLIAFQGFGFPKRHPDALLANTMHVSTMICGQDVVVLCPCLGHVVRIC